MLPALRGDRTMFSFIRLHAFVTPKGLSSGQGLPALLSLSTRPSAMGCNAMALSDSVRTEMITSPRSLSTLVGHVMLEHALCSFLQTFFIESIFRIVPKVEAGSHYQTSRT